MIRRALRDSTLIAFAAAILIWPLFRVEYFDNWSSIDGVFIGDARFLREHLPHPGWLPLWYGGTRFDYIYPPAMRYGTVLLSFLPGMSVARAYHAYSALFYAITTAGVFALVLAGTRSRKAAWAAAIASAAFSPAMLFLKAIRDDSLLHMPQRLNVIVKWGEVPHMSALGLLLLGLACAWVGLPARRPGLLAAAAALFAMAVSNNFYGGMALAYFFPLMVASLWLAYGRGRIWLDAAGVAVLAIGLTAFWLTPSYLRITMRNLILVSAPAKLSSRFLLLGLLAVWGALAWRFARRKPDRAWVVFLSGALVVFGLNAVGRYYGNIRILGEPYRFIPEADLVLILMAIEGVRSRRWSARAAGVALLASSLILALPYLRHPWSVYRADPHPERSLEYRLSDWVARNLPGSRVYLSGSVCFWANAWNDIQQVSGGSAQGLLNLNAAMIDWQFQNERNAVRDIDWLYAAGADAIMVHLPNSRESYHPIANPEKFATLPVLLDDHEGNIIYRVARRYPGLARVVDRRRMAGIVPIPYHTQNGTVIRDYVETLEKGPGAAATSEWLDSRRLRIRARVGEGESVAALVSWDPAWRATSAGRELPIYPDPNNAMRIDAPPGDHEIVLEFTTPLENQVGRVITALSLILLAAAITRSAALRSGSAVPRG
jgi:hypothetical protein